MTVDERAAARPPEERAETARSTAALLRHYRGSTPHIEIAGRRVFLASEARSAVADALDQFAVEILSRP